MIYRGLVFLLAFFFAVDAFAVKKKPRKKTLRDLEEYFNLETSLQALQFHSSNPSDRSLFPQKTDSGNQLLLRQIAEVYFPIARLETNVYHLMSSNTSRALS